MHYIEYLIDVKGFFSENSIEVSIYNEHITKSVLSFIRKPNDTFDSLFIRFYFSESIPNREIATHLAKPLLDCVIKHMIYTWAQYYVSHREPMINSCFVENEDRRATGSIEITNENIVNISDSEIQDLLINISSTSLSSSMSQNEYFNKFIDILKEEDMVARYLLLYSLLLDIKSGHQKNVDEYIRIIEPNVQEFPTERPNCNFMETKYSWWRNQSQHFQEMTNIKEISFNYKELVTPLQRIVFQAIIDELS